MKMSQYKTSLKKYLDLLVAVGWGFAFLAIRFSIVLVIIQLCALTSFAAAPFAFDNYYEQNNDLVNRYTREVDMGLLGKVHLLAEQYRFSLSRYIPIHNLPPNDDGDVIARRVLKHTLQNFIDNYKEVPGSGVNTVVRVNNNMKTSVGSSTHSLVFRLKPVEALVELRYKGKLPIEAKFIYEIEREESRVELSREWAGKVYAYTRVESPDQSVDLFSVRWGF